MATKNNALTQKGGSLEDLKEKITSKEKPRKKDLLNLSKKQPKKSCRTKESKEKHNKLVRNQEDQCLESPSSTLEGSEVFGQPIPELYPELSEELERPMDTSVSDENNNKQEIRLQMKEQLDYAQDSSDDSQPIGIKKRRKMLIPKKFERQLNLDSDDDEEFPVVNPIHGSDREQKDKDPSEKQTQRTGSWVQCSLPHCGKWRCLDDKVDPNNLPDKWVCSLNPDSRYNRCQASQEDFDSQDEDFDVVYSPYPEGAIVWAKLAGYPWWPGMMENDPDYGYYCETVENSREPVSYHVVFFDKDVSRAWVSTCSVRLFQADDNPEDQGNVVIRKKNFKKKLDLAAEQAKQALSLPPENRLNAYGFARRFKGPMGHQNKPKKYKKNKLGVVEEEEKEKKEERHEVEDVEYEEDYLNSAESNEYSESSENFSEELCEKIKKKTPTKKMKKSNADPANSLAKKGRKKETDNAEKSDTNKGVKTTASKVKKNIKLRKKSIQESEKAAKLNSTEKGKKLQDNTPNVPMSAVSADTKELVTSPTSSESPKSPIPPSHNGERPGQVSFDVAKETNIKEKTKTKKRKLEDKKKDGEDLEKKEKTPSKETRQTDQENETRIKPADKKPAKMMATNTCKTQDLGVQVNKIAGSEKPLGEEDHVSDKTDIKDVQTPETAPVHASTIASSSFQFTNMPKLIKASFKPPSKRSSEQSNTSCHKPLKMPKLWKPQFVCPAVAAAAEKAGNLLKGNKNEQRCQSEKKDCKQAQVVAKRSVSHDDMGRYALTDKRPYLQNEAVRKDPGLSDEVEVELAKLDRDIEDMKKEFNNSMNPNEKKELPLKGDMILTEDSPEF